MSTILLLTYMISAITADTCFGKNGKWWRGVKCNTHNTECGCQTCTPCQSFSTTVIDGDDWNQRCHITHQDPRGNPAKWPEFVYDTAFSRTDPAKDQEWILKVEIAADDDSHKPAVELATWAVGLAGAFAGKPLAAMIPFAAEKAMDYLGFGDDDDEATVIELDLKDTVDRILEIVGDHDDQDNLQEKLELVSQHMRLAKDELKALVSDKSIEKSLDTIVYREASLKDKFVELFDSIRLLESRPEAAWYLYEPLFALMDTRFQFKMLEYGYEWAQASGAKQVTDAAGTYPELIDQGVRETVCENLAEYLEGPLEADGTRDSDNTGSLSYQWKLFHDYFNLAWDRRMAAIATEVTVTQSAKKTAELWDFDKGFESHNKANHDAYNENGCKWAELDRDMSVDWVWEDSWTWGRVQRENAAEFQSSWRAESDFEYCYHGFGKQYNAQLCCNKSSHVDRREGPIYNGYYCRVNYAGQRTENVDPEGLNNYLAKANAERLEIYGKFHAAYAAMQNTLRKTIQSCKAFTFNLEIDQLQSNLAVPNGPIPRSMLEQNPHCVTVQPWLETKSCPAGYVPHAREGIVWSQGIPDFSMHGGMGGPSEAERCPFRYYTLEEAQAACEHLPKCDGITRDNGLCGGKRYELRGTGNGYMTYWKGGTTWVKTTPAMIPNGETCADKKIITIYYEDATFETCHTRCAEHSYCSFFRVEKGVSCKLISTCLEEERYVTSTPTKTYKMQSAVWCKSEEPVYEAFTYDEASRESFSNDPVKPVASNGSQCGDIGGDSICLERYLGFILSAGVDAGYDGNTEMTRNLHPYSDVTKSFSLSRVDFTTSFGADGFNDIEVWRAPDDAFNSAYIGADNMVPIAEGKFRFIAVMTDGATELGPISVRADPHDDFYVYEDKETTVTTRTLNADLGELHKSQVLPSGFRPGDVVCASLPTTRNLRESKTRHGLFSHEDGTCRYQVTVNSYDDTKHYGKKVLEYRGDCAGITFQLAEKYEGVGPEWLYVQPGFPHEECNALYNAKVSLLQVVNKHGEIEDWEAVGCSNRSFALEVTRILPTAGGRRRTQELPAAAPKISGIAPVYD